MRSSISSGGPSTAVRRARPRGCPRSVVHRLPARDAPLAPRRAEESRWGRAWATRSGRTSAMRRSSTRQNSRRASPRTAATMPPFRRAHSADHGARDRRRVGHAGLPPVGPAAHASGQHAAHRRSGVVEVTTVEPVDPDRLTEEDAARAGTRSLAELRRLLDRREGEHVYRMEVRLAGPDPRVALRERAELTEPERRELDARLDRMDAAWPAVDPRGAPAHRCRPGVRAPDLARPWRGTPCRSSGTSGSSRSSG